MLLFVVPQPRQTFGNLAIKTFSYAQSTEEGIIIFSFLFQVEAKVLPGIRSASERSGRLRNITTECTDCFFEPLHMRLFFFHNLEELLSQVGIIHLLGMLREISHVFALITIGLT